MAIKVIERGEIPKEVRCNYCDSLLTYTNSDVSSNISSSISSKHIVCPVCEHKIILEAVKNPNNFR